MSIQAVAWALEQDLPARPKLVLVSICNHANHTDGYCWLKAETIAKEAACTPRSIYNFVGALVRNGFIRKQLRKSEDGKQRATDYWVLFEREEKEWDNAANLEPDAAESEPEEIEPSEADPPTDCVPAERHSGGENYHPDERRAGGELVEMSPRSCGPVESAFHRKRIEEPSESNPEASSARARVRSAALRSYRPPPPQPLAADTEVKTKPIFVYEGSRAWDAWSAYEAKRKGIRKWDLKTKALIAGKWRTGWWWPTLFPPSEATTTRPPKDTLTQDDQNYIREKQGL